MSSAGFETILNNAVSLVSVRCSEHIGLDKTLKEFLRKVASVTAAPDDSPERLFEPWELAQRLQVPLDTVNAIALELHKLGLLHLKVRVRCPNTPETDENVFLETDDAEELQSVLDKPCPYCAQFHDLSWDNVETVLALNVDDKRRTDFDPTSFFRATPALPADGNPGRTDDGDRGRSLLGDTLRLDDTSGSLADVLRRALQSNKPIVAVPHLSEIRRPTKQVVLLIHGIRTRAEWQGMVRSVLEVPGRREVVPIKYGYFDVFQFLCPIATRRFPIGNVLWRLEKATDDHKTAEIIVIAHSFGTYALATIMKMKPGIRPVRVILCGSIISADFRWDQLPKCPAIINECGSKDIWPVFATCTTWGYGASGTFGFGTPGIRDRHHCMTHSGYFSQDFVKHYWEPFVSSGEVVNSDYERDQPASPWYLSLLAVIPVQWTVLIGLLAAVTFMLFRGRWQH